MSVLTRGTLCITVGHPSNPKNNGRVVRVLHHAGQTWTGMKDGYVIECVNGIPFSTIVQHRGGGYTVVNRNRDTRCTAERSNLRPLLYPGFGHPILEQLAVRELAPTEANYLLLAFPEGAPDPLPAEDRAEMEEALEQIAPRLADVTVAEHGSIYLLTPKSDSARAWLQDHVQEDAQWFGNALVVEHRYVAAIVEGLHAAGLE